MKSFKPVQVIAVNPTIAQMAWSCAPNRSVANAEKFCKAH